jgi:hypothetical protein
MLPNGIPVTPGVAIVPGTADVVVVIAVDAAGARRVLV